MDDFTAEQHRVLRDLRNVSASLSVAGCLFIVLSFTLFRSLRTNVTHIVLFLTLSDLASSISYFFPMDEGSTCKAQGWTSQFFELASFFWVVSLAVLLYRKVVRGKEVGRRDLVYAHVCVWSLSLCAAIPVSATDCYGDAGPWCWIRSGGTCTVLRYVTFYGPLIISLGITVVLYALVLRKIRSVFSDASGMSKEESTRARQTRAQVEARVARYVAAFFFVRVWSVINRFHALISGDENFELFALQAFFSPLQGAANAVIYGMQPRLFAMYKEAWHRFRGGAPAPPEPTHREIEQQPLSDELAVQ